MDYTQDTIKHVKGKHFSYGDRRELQGMLSNKSVRYEFGHWEIDTVIGSKSKSDKVVLTIVEHLTRKYIAIKINGKTASAVSAATQSLRKYYGDKFSQIFKTITSDNGSEFAELSKLENDTTTKVYFAHPYSSWERGSNERHNGLLRRFIPKGEKIDEYASDDILFTADWYNLLPRKILEYKTPDDLFENEQCATSNCNLRKILLAVF